MANIILSANMSLPIPVVGVEPGPDYASDVDACLMILDGHTHNPGSGVKITPSGININAALAFNSNYATVLLATRWDPQSVPLSGPLDLNEAYVSGVDLWFNDGNGNQIQITQSGGVAGAPGSISNLTPPASAQYVSADDTFVWQSAANTPANLDFASAIFRNLVANSFGLTVSAPASMGSDISIVLPAPPVSNSFLTIDTSGNMSGSVPISLGITGSMIANGTIDQSKLSGAFGLIPSGAILPFGGTSAPSGYLMCDGAAVSRATYSNLFAAIGVAYGEGDASTTFNLPDFRGAFMRGVDGASGRDPDAASRIAITTGGNTGDNVGSYQPTINLTHIHQWYTPAAASGVDTSFDSTGTGVQISSAGAPTGGGTGIGLVTSGQVYTAGTPLKIRSLSPAPGTPSLYTTTQTPIGTTNASPVNVYVNYIVKT